MSDLPIGVDIDNLIADLKNISWEAADILLYYSEMMNNPEYKNEVISLTDMKSPVTTADLKVNEIILKRIREKYPRVEWGFISEENYKLRTNHYDKQKEWKWILDPLDGTKDFIQGTGNYAMHLCLSYKNKPFIGVVLIPEKNELWISNGSKVFCYERDGSQKNISISSPNDLEEMILVTSKNHNNLILKDLIEKINFKRINVMGSIGCKIASIIRGENDIYISLSLPNGSYPRDWDFAAPHAILEAFGGAITNINNSNLTYDKPNFNQKGIIIASKNKLNHRKICFQIKQIIKENNILY